MNRFIYTSNKDTAEALKLSGYKMIKSNTNMYVFMNDKNIQLNFKELKNVGYTNMLTF